MNRSNPYKRPDHFTKMAKQAGYPARSVFKLDEIDRRVGLLRRGMRVLDLGASPGSWALYASERVGREGCVFAVDLEPLRVSERPNLIFVQGDALTLENEALSAHAPYDVVLSDMAPKTTGQRVTDLARSEELFLRALDVARELLVPGGAFVGKIFMSGDLPSVRTKVREGFASERILRPEGTRVQSYEIFIVAEGKKPDASRRA